MDGSVMKTTDVIYLDLLTDLKSTAISEGAVVFMKGKSSIGDGQGGFYMWQPAATNTEDTVYLNYIKSNLSTTGRWVRLFQRSRPYNTGVLVSNGNVKTHFIDGITDANGNIALNLTSDATTGGDPIFSEIWSIGVSPQTNAAGPGDAVQSYRKSLTTDNKTLVYGFYKANAVTITLGLLLVPVASIGPGTKVSFRIEGI